MQDKIMMKSKAVKKIAIGFVGAITLFGGVAMGWIAALGDASKLSAYPWKVIFVAVCFVSYGLAFLLAHLIWEFDDG